ncbi:MAG: hypothetical protein EBZ59_07555 [Planctomycetia bacterium]|nr:hypothetical protein [Planctomycetia bacterium]
MAGAAAGDEPQIPEPAPPALLSPAAPLSEDELRFPAPAEADPVASAAESGDRGPGDADAAACDPETEPEVVPASAATEACGDESKKCREALEQLRDDGIASIDLDIRVGGTPGNDYPCECRLEGETFRPRRFASTTFTWKAAGYCHKPLYFEDWNLERYGHSHGWLADPFVSAAHFFVTLPVLPYKMGVELPWECIYPLGYYRPGNCAPWTCPAVPISVRGMAVEAATITGIVFVLP